MKVGEAITAVMADVRAVGKDGVNQQQNFNFRGVDAVVNALSPVMRKHGLTVRPSGVIHKEHQGFTSKSGALGISTRLIVEYTFTGPEGDELKSVVASEANDYGDKSTAKAMSVAFRTCLLQAFALPTTETDPDAESYDRGQAFQQQQHRTEPQTPEEAFEAARGKPDALKALRVMAKNRGLPADHPLFEAIENELSQFSADAPIEGTIQ